MQWVLVVLQGLGQRKIRLAGSRYRRDGTDGRGTALAAAWAEPDGPTDSGGIQGEIFLLKKHAGENLGRLGNKAFQGFKTVSNGVQSLYGKRYGQAAGTPDLQQENEELQQQLRNLQQQLVQKEALIAYYLDQLRLLQKKQFGTSSEKNVVVPKQLSFFIL